MPDYDPDAKAAQAQAAGRKGGLEGGNSTAKSLPANKRRRIARKALETRSKIASP